MTTKKARGVQDIAALIAQHDGNLSAVARALGYKSRGLLYRRIKESATLQSAVDDARESFVDEVESSLYQNARNGNVAAQIFIMKAHPVAKRRGWGERQELTGADNGAMVIKMTWGDAGGDETDNG